MRSATVLILRLRCQSTVLPPGAAPSPLPADPEASVSAPAPARADRPSSRSAQSPAAPQTPAGSRSFFFNVFSTSSQVTGVDTVGCSRARSEYTETVVLCSSFWLQSTNTFPPADRLLHLGDNQFRMLMLQQARQRMRKRLGLVISGGRIQRAHTPAAPSIPKSSGNSAVRNARKSRAARRPPAQHCTIFAGGPGSRSNTSIVGQS